MRRHMDEEYRFSAPGRVEIGGNHTDHQHGRVLAAAINLESKAIVRRNCEGKIRVISEGYEPVEIDVWDLGVHEEEKSTTAALIRGVAAAFTECGCKLGGLDAKVSSTVLPGSGLSSSAAFEVLIGRIFNGLFFEDKLTPVQIAQIGQYAENVYFGKPCGLMDQTASSVGGLVYIDFRDPAHPVVENVEYDFNGCGYTLCIIDSGADHAGLTENYAAIPGELHKVCRVFGREYLRDVDESEFYARLPEVRKVAGDRGALRAMHIFDDSRRVAEQVAALRNNDFDCFLKLVNDSGDSSWKYLQNVIPSGSREHQSMAFTIALCKKLLNSRGAVRVHGGGFAGTALALVPDGEFNKFREGVERVLGAGCCHKLSIAK